MVAYRFIDLVVIVVFGVVVGQGEEAIEDFVVIVGGGGAQADFGELVVVVVGEKGAGFIQEI